MGRYSWVPQMEEKSPGTSCESIHVRNADRALSPLEFLKSRARTPVMAVLDNIRSAYNVGSIFRTSDSACLEKLILCGCTAYPPNDKLEKTSLGSTAYVPWDYHRDAVEAVKCIRSQGIFVASLETTDRSVNYSHFRFPERLCIVLGNEVKGVNPEILHESDVVLEVPTFGMKNSLNVATLFGIVAYEIVRQYDAKKTISDPGCP
jgi:23S rRNA (guanosine2251-2'-O)-methyltransferase